MSLFGGEVRGETYLHTVHIFLQEIHQFTEGVGGLGECLYGAFQLVHFPQCGLSVFSSGGFSDSFLSLLIIVMKDN